MNNRKQYTPTEAQAEYDRLAKELNLPKGTITVEYAEPELLEKLEQSNWENVGTIPQRKN